MVGESDLHSRNSNNNNKLSRLAVVGEEGALIGVRALSRLLSNRHRLRLELCRRVQGLVLGWDGVISFQNKLHLLVGGVEGLGLLQQVLPLGEGGGVPHSRLLRCLAGEDGEGEEGRWVGEEG